MKNTMPSIFNTFLGKYCIIRSQSAGVFAAQLNEIDDSTVRLTNARRLWYWKGAASLSELSQEGVSEPESCKFPTPIPELIVFGVIEIIPCSEKAINSIANTPIWSESGNPQTDSKNKDTVYEF